MQKRKLFFFGTPPFSRDAFLFFEGAADCGTEACAAPPRGAVCTWTHLDLGRATREWRCASFCLQSLQKVVKESGTPVEDLTWNIKVMEVPSYLPGNFLTYPPFEKALSGVDGNIFPNYFVLGGAKIPTDTQVDVPVAEAVQGSE